MNTGLDLPARKQASFVMVLHRPHPLTEVQVAVGAYVDTVVDGIWAVPVHRLPCAECIGMEHTRGLTHVRDVRFAYRRLDVTGFPYSPDIGPSFMNGPVRQIPGDVAKPAAWVRGLLNGWREIRPLTRWFEPETGRTYVVVDVTPQPDGWVTLIAAATSGDSRAKVRWHEMYNDLEPLKKPLGEDPGGSEEYAHD